MEFCDSEEVLFDVSYWVLFCTSSPLESKPASWLAYFSISASSSWEREFSGSTDSSVYDSLAASASDSSDFDDT